MLWRALCLVLLLAGFSAAAQAQAVLEARFDAGNPPFASERQGQAVGYYPQIVEAAARRAGLKLQGQAVPWVRALRALALLQRSLGSLDQVRAILKVNVFTQAAEDFTQLSEVADAASALLHEVLGSQAGAHARTSVGVYQLPKNATVELDLVAVVD